MNNDDLSSPLANKIIPVDITAEMKDCYISYAMSTIVDRALPDVRDGFKPVHRRILYGMDEMGNTHNKPYKKAARIVGTIMGLYHPHGDSSIYGALVRMGQEWSMNAPLVDGQGNFGSHDGDPCAAMRYTEARLAKLSNYLFEEINKDCIEWGLNYDDSTNEPKVLPAMFPQLLVNGTSGIAVGMACSILPHNLHEVIDATIALINNPNIADEELLALLPGPDFATGGVIYGMDNVKQGMLTGRGSTTLRGGYDIEESKNGRLKLVITSVPYTVFRDKLVEEIGEMVKDGTLAGISDVNNESTNKDGTRIVIDLKKDATPSVVINHLYKHTKLQITQTINNTVLVDGRPQELSTFQMIREWIKFRFEVVTKRIIFDIAELKKRLEILKGYIIVLNDLDKAIAIIRDSQTPVIAKASLIKEFRVNENQAKHILDLRLAKLTGLEIEGIKAEHAELELKVKALKTILGSDALIYDDIKESLVKIDAEFGHDRLTRIDYAGESADMDQFIENKDIIISVSNIGYVKRTDINSYKVQGRGGKGNFVAKTKDDDFVKHVIYTNTHSYLLIFTDKGRCYHIKSYLIPEGERNTKGRPIQNFVDLQGDEKIVSFATTETFEDKVVFLCTKSGVIKKMTADLLVNKNSKKAGVGVVTIDGEDELLGATISDDTNTVVVANEDGDVIRFPDSAIRPMGRIAMGNFAMKCKSPLVSLLSCDDDELYAITISEHGFGKKTSIDQYRITGRYNKGLSTMKCTKKTGKLVKLLLAKKTEDIMISCKSGKSIRINVSDIKTISRNTQGVILVDIGNKDTISDATVIYEGPEE